MTILLKIYVAESIIFAHFLLKANIKVRPRTKNANPPSPPPQKKTVI